jgi:amino acid transporter
VLILLQVFSVLAGLASLAALLGAFSGGSGPGGGISFLVGVSAFGSLLFACLAYGWMAHVLMELRGLRKDLRQSLGAPPVRPLQASSRTEPTLSAQR